MELSSDVNLKEDFVRKIKELQNMVLRRLGIVPRCLSFVVEKAPRHELLVAFRSCRLRRRW
jgi:hypothetical protein